MRFLATVITLTVTIALAPAQTITAITNAASYLQPTLPNEGVAQGAMFVIKGTRLGPGTFAVATTFPLSTTIGDASVRVTVGATTVNALMYYAGDTQVAAILPSSTPLGDATAVVTYGGRPTPSFRFKVVRNAFGVFTVPQSGLGDAIATLGNGFVSPLNAANAGDIVAFWGTGLGAVTGNEANAATQTDLTNVPVEAFVGGRPAEVLFRGRNGCCSAVDNVYIKIPEGVAGCVTPVIFKIGNIVSNSVSIPLASSGRACTPANPAVSASRAAELFAKPTLTTGRLRMWGINGARTPANPDGTTPTQVDQAFAKISRATVPPGALGLGGLFDIRPMGSCWFSSYAVNALPVLEIPVPGVSAGSTLTALGPGGQRTIGNRTGPGDPSVTYAGTLARPAFMTGGSFTITAPGAASAAAGVGAFSVTANQPPPLVWTHPLAAPVVVREQGFTVNWTGGDPNGWVEISINSQSKRETDNGVVVDVFCNARTSAGTFTVPPAALLALPPTSADLPLYVSVKAFSAPAPFQAAGMDFGVMTLGNENFIYNGTIR